MPGYFSEIGYDGNVHQDFIEVAVPTGTDVSGWTVLTYHTDGTLQETFTLGSSTQTIAGKDVYVVNKDTAGFVDIGATRGYALVDDTGTVQQFISFSEAITATEGAAAGQSAQQMGDLTGPGESMETTDGGATYQAQSTTSKAPLCAMLQAR
ncbi:hypothetical protein [Leisingera methylohalidivorans]|uniref:LTD domain-containing protein n=1 Tax=Leisingera methylohalidivorans DSM 14336 TaxID=999552 RepID=V9W2U8_9RHOB|nr:hypothetical protein [Leisingera methylohalidivorans]AHD03507.1 hypothetical protein METH_22020 [Leisingera methylohalidivorans DSM 14336]